MTNLLPATPLKFRVPFNTLGDSLSELGAFPLECTEFECPQFDGPSLFVRGTQSGYIQPQHLPTIKRMFPNMELIELNGNHWIHVDQPLGVVKAMYQKCDGAANLDLNLYSGCES